MACAFPPMTGPTNYGLDIGALSGNTTNYGINIGAISVGKRMDMASTSETFPAEAPARLCSQDQFRRRAPIAYQLNLGTITGANPTAHYGINMGNISGITATKLME